MPKQKKNIMARMVNDATQGPQNPPNADLDEKYIRGGVRQLFAIASANPKYGLKLEMEPNAKEEAVSAKPVIILPSARFSKKVVDIIRDYTLVSIKEQQESRTTLKTEINKEKLVERIWLTIFFVCALARTNIAYEMRNKKNIDVTKRKKRDELLNWVKRSVEYYTDRIHYAREQDDVSSAERMVYYDIVLLFTISKIEFPFIDKLTTLCQRSSSEDADVIKITKDTLSTKKDLDKLMEKIKSTSIKAMAKLGPNEKSDDTDTDDTAKAEGADTTEAESAAEAERKKEADEAAKKKEADEAAKKKEAEEAAEAERKKKEDKAAKEEAEGAKKEDNDDISSLPSLVDEAEQEGKKTARGDKKETKVQIAAYQCKVPSGLINKKNAEQIAIKSLEDINSYSTLVIDWEKTAGLGGTLEERNRNLQTWLKDEDKSLVVVNGLNEDEYEYEDEEEDEDEEEVPKREVLRIAQNTGKCIWQHNEVTNVLLISEHGGGWVPDADKAGLVRAKWDIIYGYTKPERVIVANEFSSSNLKFLGAVLAQNVKPVKASEADEAEADEADVIVADTIESLELIVIARNDYDAAVLIGDGKDKNETEKRLREIAKYDDGTSRSVYKARIAHGKISEPVYVIASDIYDVGCFDAGLLNEWENITYEEDEGDSSPSSSQAEAAPSKKKGTAKEEEGEGEEEGEDEEEGDEEAEAAHSKKKGAAKEEQKTLVVVPEKYDPKNEIVSKILKELGDLIYTTTIIELNCKNAHKYDTVVIFHTTAKKEADDVKIPNWNAKSKLKRIFWYGDFRNHSTFSKLLVKSNDDDDEEEEEAKWEVHASRQENERVIFYAHENQAPTNQEKWTRVSAINLAATQEDSRKEVRFCDAVGEKGLDVVLKIAEPSTQAMLIRKQGIRAALDYVSFLYGKDTSVKKKSSMCEHLDAISPLQQLVYLTLRPSSSDIGVNTKFVRLYSLAPGSGKTRAMALALFDARRRDFGVPICVILTNKNVREHLMDEILRTMKAGGEALIDLRASNNSGQVVENRNEYWYSVMSHHLGLGSGDYIEDRNTVYKATIELLKANRINVLLLDDLISSVKTQTNHGTEVTGATVVVADECHEILSRIGIFTSCKTFYGFSATPFLKNGNRDAVSMWVKEGKTPADYDFVKENVCLASGRDVRAFLPYAKLKYKLRFATCDDPLPSDKNPVHTIRVTTDAEDTSSDETKKTHDAEYKDYEDYNEKLDEQEYKAAIKKVIEEIKGKTRSYVYIEKGMINLFKSVVSEENNTLENNQRIGLVSNLSEFVDTSFVTPYELRVFLDEGESKDTIELRNTINEEVQHNVMAVVTTSYHSVQYKEMNATYIIGFPYNENGPDVDKCIQARNRAFRMCGHADINKPHPIHYVLVERGDLMRGAYALAMVHPQKKEDSDIHAHRLVVDMHNVNKTVLHGIVQGDTSRVAELIAKHKLLYDNSEKRAQTIFDLYNKLSNIKGQLRVVSYDDRIIMAIRKVLDGKNAKVGRDVIGSAELDSGTSPAPAHHDLRGLRFTLVSESDYENIKSDITSGTHTAKGSLVLDYETCQTGHDPNAELVGSLRDKGLIVVGPCRSYTVYADVNKVYYRRADKIQCIGQARYECFRVFPPEADRFFVGTPEEFDRFVDLISGRDIYNKPCGSESDARVTPMMIAIVAKRELLKNKTVTIKVKEGGYGKKLTHFLQNALGPWRTSAVSKDSGLKEMISIEIDDREMDVSEIDEEVSDTEEAHTEAAQNDTKKIIYTLKEEQLVQSQEVQQVNNNTNNSTKKKPVEDQKDAQEEAVKKNTETQETQAPKKEKYEKEKGTLVVFDSGESYGKSKLKEISSYRWLGMVDIRNKGPYKSRLDESTNVRCTKAVFLTSKADTTIKGYAAARIVADRYVMDNNIK